MAIEEGTYDFEVTGVRKGQSKKGNDMITLELLADTGERTFNCKAWLVNKEGFCIQKKDEFLDATGGPLPAWYDDPQTLIGRKGKAEFKRNSNGFLSPEGWVTTQAVSTTPPASEENMPF